MTEELRTIVRLAVPTFYGNGQLTIDFSNNEFAAVTLPYGDTFGLKGWKGFTHEIKGFSLEEGGTLLVFEDKFGKRVPVGKIDLDPNSISIDPNMWVRWANDIYSEMHQEYVRRLFFGWNLNCLPRHMGWLLPHPLGPDLSKIGITTVEQLLHATHEQLRSELPHGWEIEEVTSLRAHLWNRARFSGWPANLKIGSSTPARD